MAEQSARGCAACRLRLAAVTDGAEGRQHQLPNLSRLGAGEGGAGEEEVCLFGDAARRAVFEEELGEEGAAGEDVWEGGVPEDRAEEAPAARGGGVARRGGAGGRPGVPYGLPRGQWRGVSRRITKPVSQLVE